MCVRMQYNHKMGMKLKYSEEIERFENKINVFQEKINLIQNDIIDVGENDKTQTLLYLTTRLEGFKEIIKELEDKQKPVSVTLVI